VFSKSFPSGFPALLSHSQDALPELYFDKHHLVIARVHHIVLDTLQAGVALASMPLRISVTGFGLEKQLPVRLRHDHVVMTVNVPAVSDPGTNRHSVTITRSFDTCCVAFA
jgi:hypothetical protein